MKWNHILLNIAFLTILSLSPVIVLGQFDSTGCADPNGLDDCRTLASDALDACIHGPDSENTNNILECSCAQYISDMNCYATHCWNRVYECDYQTFIGAYFELCPTAQFPVPYSPPPNGTVTDSCSCDIGNILMGISTSIQHGEACLPPNETTAVDLVEIHTDNTCGCCVYSGAISSVYNFCPSTNPNLTGLMTVNEFANQVPFNVCSPFLSTADCPSVLNLSAETVGGTFFKPNNLPTTTGTATLTNLPGTVTAPASGNVFTYTNGGDGAVYTIVAANAPGGHGGGGGAASPLGGGGGIGKLNGAMMTSPSKPFGYLTGVILVGGLQHICSLF